MPFFSTFRFSGTLFPVSMIDGDESYDKSLTQEHGVTILQFEEI